MAKNYKLTLPGGSESIIDETYFDSIYNRLISRDLTNYQNLSSLNVKIAEKHRLIQAKDHEKYHIVLQRELTRIAMVLLYDKEIFCRIDADRRLGKLGWYAGSELYGEANKKKFLEQQKSIGENLSFDWYDSFTGSMNNEHRNAYGWSEWEWYDKVVSDFEKIR